MKSIKLSLCVIADAPTCCMAIQNLRWSNSSLICTPTAMGNKKGVEDEKRNVQERERQTQVRKGGVNICLK